MGLYRKINGQLETISGANASGLPLGSIIPIYNNVVPAGYLPCNGQVFDEQQYPALYLLLGSNVLPDLRECVLVGSGENETNVIAAHDVYSIGEFKDDQFQGHEHRQTLTQYVNADAGNYNKAGAGGQITTDIVEKSGYGAPRYGTTTHGKQIGVNYVIKAVTGLTDSSGESLIVSTAINQATDRLEQAVEDICEQLVQDSLNAMYYHILPLTVDSTRHVSIDSNQLLGINYIFRQTFADQVTGTWTIRNTGDYAISVSRYGGRGNQSRDRMVTFTTIQPNSEITFILDSDDPYLDSDTFSLEVIRAS